MSKEKPWIADPFSKITLELFIRLKHLCGLMFEMGTTREFKPKLSRVQYNSLKKYARYLMKDFLISSDENHEGWAKRKEKEGWVYGKVKDTKKRTHPYLIPFQDLPALQKNKNCMSIHANKEILKFIELLRVLLKEELEKAHLQDFKLPESEKIKKVYFNSGVDTAISVMEACLATEVFEFSEFFLAEYIQGLKANKLYYI